MEENTANGGGGESRRRSSSAEGGGIKGGNSCKGCLYYSSLRKSNNKKPICFGISRTLKHVPGYIVGESESKVSKEGRNLLDFKYTCVGYSVVADSNDNPTGKPAELPFCVGIELLADKRAVNSSHAPSHAHSKEDAHNQPGGLKPPSYAGVEFLNRFSRNAGLVAFGVARNLNKVGNCVKDSIDDILYSYRRRPK